MKKEMDQKDAEKKMEKILKDVPKKLPSILGMLTTAGHLHAAKYDVKEISFAEEGAPDRTLIFTPVIFDDGGHMNCMFEVRMNALLTIQQAAELCGVKYRTIQRWRDEDGLPVFSVDGQPFFASGMVRDFAAKKGHCRSGKRLKKCN
ncbi:MAG: helix-turn-helix domain-containing protein [Desulfobacula sp.]|jgi:hypothetical protein